MSTFERIYRTDALRESEVDREHLSIALSDQEYLRRIRRDSHAIDVKHDVEIPSEMKEAMQTIVEKIEFEEKHAKGESKSAKRKSKKNHR